MSIAKQSISKHYQRIISQWPRDTLRPEVSFTAALQLRLNKHTGDSTTATTATIPPAAAAATDASSSTLRATATPSGEAAEMEQLNALYSLLENRYQRKFPLTAKSMQPQSNPQYYDNLIREIEEAPTRGRFTAWVNSWKGFLRWK